MKYTTVALCLFAAVATAIPTSGDLMLTLDPDFLRTMANKTHYGNPTDGCLPDEQPVRINGLSGDFCSPDCTSAACPTDVPAGVTAKPQCALQSTTGDKKCALICSPSTDEASLRAGDAMCGKATCQPIQGTGICTYGGGPAPPPGPPSNSTCTPQIALECLEGVAQCLPQCKTGAAAC